MIYLGYISLASSIGFFLGASNTPVVGDFITAIFGLLGTVIGAQYLFDKSTDVVIKAKHLSVGVALISVSLVCAALVGENYRKSHKATERLALPWKGLESPSNTYEALDWIATSEKMKQLGYTHEDVQSLYKIRALERKRLIEQRDKQVQQGIEDHFLVDIYDFSEPYSQMISGELYKEDIGRGLASD